MEIKYHNVITDGRNLFDRSVKNDLETYKNIQKIATGQRDNYTKVSLLDYPHLKNFYKLIATDSSKQQALDADPKAILQDI